MADIAIIGLGLDTTQLAAGATRAVTALQQVEAAARQAQSVLATLGQSFQQQATATGQLTTAGQAHTVQTHALTTAMQQLTTATQGQQAQATLLTSATHQLVQAHQQTVGALNQLTTAQQAHHTQTRQVSSGLEAWQTVLQGARLAVGALGIQLGISGLVQFGKDVVQTGLRMEQLRANITSISGGLQQGTASFQFLAGVSQRLALPIDDLSRDFIGLTAATRGTVLEGEPTKRIFESIAIAARGMGVSNAEAHRGFLAIEQMLSRGTITMEEFRKQMGQALPGSMQVAARAMGMPLDALEAFIATGQQKAIPFVVRLSEQFRTEFAGGIERATSTAQAEITKFGNTWTLFKEQISKGPVEAVIRVTRIGMEALTGTVEQAAAVRARTVERFGRAGDVATREEMARGDDASRRTLIPQNDPMGLDRFLPDMGGNAYRAQQRQAGEAELLTMRKMLQARQKAEEENAEEKAGWDRPSREANIAQLEQAGRVQALDRALTVIPPLMRRINAEAELTPLTFQRSAEMARELSKALDKAREAAAAFPGGVGLPPAARAQLLEYDRELKRHQEQKTTETSLAKVVPLSERLAAMRTRMAEEPEQAHQILRQTISALEGDQRRLAEVGRRSETLGQSAAQGMQAEAAQKAQQLVALAETEGIRLRITSTFRTADEQARLYAQGRTTPGPIVTTAPSGTSRHERGTAFDVVPLNAQGQADWQSPAWERVGTLGRSLGLEWGGDWKTFKDRPHFQLPGGAAARGGAVSPGATDSPLIAALRQLRGEEQALAEAEREAKKTSTPDQARGAIDAARETAAQQAEKDFEALTKLSAKYHESAAERDVDTASKLRARLASSELYAEDARGLALDVEKMGALKDRLPLLQQQAAASAAVLATDQRARGSLDRYTEQFDLTPDGATITPETRALVRMRRELAPLMGTEQEGEAKRAIARAELDAAPMTRYARKVSDMAIGMFESIATGAKPSLEQLRNTFVKTLMDILLDATNMRAEMAKLLSTGVKGGIDWVGTALGVVKAGASVAGSGTADPSMSELQYGGPAYANAPYLVGEAGPEIFVPATNGTVLPHGQSAGQPIVINVFGATDAGSFVRASGQINRAIYQAQQGALRDS